MSTVAGVEPDQLIHMLRTAERLFGMGSFTWSAAGVGYPGEGLLQVGDFRPVARLLLLEQILNLVVGDELGVGGRAHAPASPLSRRMRGSRYA